MDMISKLPQGIIETILGLLPIQEAARTSVLAREWRYQWTKIPKLAFIEDAFQVSKAVEEDDYYMEHMYYNPFQKKEPTAKRCKFFHAINQVLSVHQGPIREFTLRMKYDDSDNEFDDCSDVGRPCVEIDNIILELSRKNTIEKLHLDYNTSYEGYRLPISLFSLQRLTNMFLSDCALFDERLINDLGCLTTLYLECLWTCEKTLVRLLSSCPLLTQLTLESDFSTISDSGHTTVDNLFECLPVIEHLTISFFIVQCFSPERLPKELPTPLMHLKYLRMTHVCFTHIYGLRFLALLIKSCPNLEKLKLLMHSKLWLDDVDMGSFTLEEYSGVVLEHLNELEIVEFTDAENEMDFVKLILAKSPVLKTVRILCALDTGEESRISEVLLCSPCASPVVKISVKQMTPKYPEMDLISKLPQGIIETILCLIPIQEAARTSILARDWRYRWTKIPKLAFIEDAFQVSKAVDEDDYYVEHMFYNPFQKKEPTAKRCKFFHAINQVLSMHQGPIREFTLRTKYDDSYNEFDDCSGVGRSCAEIDHMILELSRRNTIEKLHLDYNTSYEGYRLPISLFSLQRLTNMFLSDCALFDERLINELGCLTTLYLECLWTSEKTLVRLLSSCPLLTQLTLESDGSTISDSGHTTVDNLFACLPVIEHLTISFFIVKCFAPKRLPKELPTALTHLIYLRLTHVCFTHIYGLRFLALLIKSCPNLETLKLLMYSKLWLDDVDMGSFTLEDYSGIVLEHLNELEIVEFTDAENEVDFVKLILAKSPLLKKVRILCAMDTGEESRISEVLLFSPCASPVVKINVEQMTPN